MPFSGRVGSGTVNKVVKSFKLSEERWILIWEMVENGLCQLTSILPAPLTATEKCGRVSCALATEPRMRKAINKAGILRILRYKRIFLTDVLGSGKHTTKIRA